MSFEPLLKVKKKRNARCIELAISEQTVKDLIGVYLQQLSAVRASEDIVDIDMGQPDKDRIIPLKVFIKKEVSKVSGKSQKKEGLS